MRTKVGKKLASGSGITSRCKGTTHPPVVVMAESALPLVLPVPPLQHIMPGVPARPRPTLLPLSRVVAVGRVPVKLAQRRHPPVRLRLWRWPLTRAPQVPEPQALRLNPLPLPIPGG